VVEGVPTEPEIATVKFYPNLELARRIAADIGRDDAHEVYRAMERRCPGVLFIHVRLNELSRDQYDDLCYAVESEITRSRPAPLLKLEA
jgi:hypothetical protein